jgi:hypothetical protein
MPRRFVTGLVVSLTAVALAAVSASPASTAPRTISVFAVGTWSMELDTTETTPTKVGDRFAFGGDLYRWAGAKRGARAGRFEVFSTRTAPNTNTFVGTLLLPAGKLFITGSSPENGSDGTQELAVIGGTRSYAGAHGSLVVRDIGREESNTSSLSIRLAD